MITRKVLPNTCRDSRRCWVGTTTFCAAVALVLLTCAIEAAQAQNGDLVWAKRAGGTVNDNGYGIAVDSSGNSYVTGGFTGTATFGAGEPNQTILTSAANSVDLFVAKYNSSGTLAWAKRAGGTSLELGGLLSAIAVDSQSNSYVTGSFRDTATFGPGEANQTILTATGTDLDDLFIAKFSNIDNGALVWAKQAGGSSNDFGRAIAVDSTGNSYVTGSFQGTATFGFLSGPTATPIILTGLQNDHFFIAKYNSDGTIAWARGGDGGAFSTEVGRAVVVDGTGNSYITGGFAGTVILGVGEPNQTSLTATGSNDIFLAKYNDNGTLAWAKRAGGMGDDVAFGIAMDISGASYVTGYFFDTATFGAGEANQTTLISAGISDFFVAKYNGNGALDWAKRAGGTSGDVAFGIATDVLGNSYLTGRFAGTAIFGAGEANQATLISTGTNDIFVAKYKNDGTLAWAKRAGGTAVDLGSGVAVDSVYGAYVTGMFQGTATFGAGEANQTPLTAAGGGGGGQDIFVAKFAGGAILVNCPGASLQTAVNLASPGSTIAVSGACSENVLIRNEKQRITIDGGGTATISAPSAVSPALNVRGKGILIQNFTITGGSVGIYVNRGSNAVLNNNIIQNTTGNGVTVDELAFAVLTNNTIQNNLGAGIFVSEASTARIGFNSDSETVASPNTIQSNGAAGIIVSNGSSARVIGNNIINNTGDGVQVLRDAHADIASNAINGNGEDGIEVGENSFVQLGEDSGTSIYESANTTTITNTGVGVRCTNGGIADGRQGTLSGAGGAKNFAPTCIDSLAP